MKTATISETKNGLSALLDQVKAGQSILITDRGVPVARLEPVAGDEDASGRIQRLQRAGVLRVGGGGNVPLESILQPGPGLPDGVSVVEALLEERRTSR